MHKAKLIFMSLLVTVSAFGATQYVTEIEQKRKELVDQQIVMANNALAYARLYVMETGDLTPTRAEIQQRFGLSLDFWRNYAKEDCSETAGLCNDNVTGGMTLGFDSVNYLVTIDNVVGTTTDNLSDAEIAHFDTSDRHSADFARIADSETGIVYRFDDLFRSTVSLFKQVNASATKALSETAPLSAAKAWYKPNGALGGCDVYYYDPNISDWAYRGRVGAGERVLHFVDGDPFDPETTPGALGDNAKVEEDGQWVTYTHNGTHWLLVSGGAPLASQVIVEAGDLDWIIDRAADPSYNYYDVASGSTFTVTHALLVAGQTGVVFRRYVHYWASESSINVPDFTNANSGTYAFQGFIYVADDKDNLPSCSNGDMAYIKGNTGLIADTKDVADPEYEMLCIDGTWYDAVPSLEKLVDVADPAAPTFTAEVGKVMTNDSTWTSVGFWDSSGSPVDYLGLNQIVATKGDRTDLTPPSGSSRINLTAQFGDDPAYTASGVDSTYPYGADYFKRWFYSTDATALITNDMLDGTLSSHSSFSAGVAYGTAYAVYWKNTAYNIYLTTDSSFPYKTPRLDYQVYDAAYVLAQADTSVEGGWAMTKLVTGAVEQVRCGSIGSYCDRRAGSSLVGYAPSSSGGTKQVFWCSGGGTLHSLPDVSCVMGDDTSVAVCPNTVTVDAYLCIP